MPSAAHDAAEQRGQDNGGSGYVVEIRVGGQENDSWQCSCIARFRSALDCDWNIFVSRATSPRQAAKA
eukprot:SAG31_NODE_5420_length_2548_cov_1.444671_5_plen_67_part_01